MELKVESDSSLETYNYLMRNIVYECPCGHGTILWSKESPLQGGSSFSDVFWKCDTCKEKYTFSFGSVSLKN